MRRTAPVVACATGAALSQRADHLACDLPLVTTVLGAGQPLGLGDLPLVPRSVVLTAIVVPLAVLWVIPALRRAFQPRPRSADLDA